MLQSRVLISGADGKEFWATKEQADAIEVLVNARKGGFAKVYGYRPTTDYIESPITDVSIITRFSVDELYKRKVAALKAIEFNDVVDALLKEPKLAKMNRADLVNLFDERKAQEIASMEQSLDGDRSGSHRQGHDRCYAKLANGVKVNFDCTKGADGLMHPRLEKGFPVAESVMFAYLELSKTIRKDGVRKTVNSGPSVLMKNAIQSLLNKRSVGLKYLSLKENNFERLTVDGETLLAEDFQRFDGIVARD